MSLLERFDSICLSFGEYDAVVSGSSSCCYLEVQHASNLLAAQLVYRFGNPDIVLLDLGRAAAAELAAVVACIRLGILFCPVDGTDPLRLKQMIEVLRRGRWTKEQPDGPTHIPMIAAIVLAADDTDPRLTSFFHVGMHFCILVNENGDMLEPMTVPSLLPDSATLGADGRMMTTADDLYILFTSGTTSTEPKAVVGSKEQTMRRLSWLVDEIHEAKQQVIIGRHHSLLFIDGIHELLSVLMHELPAKLYCSNSLDDLVKNSTRITMLPSQLAQILPSLIPLSTTNEQSALKLVILSGEPCPHVVVSQFQTNHYFANTRLFNFYGQTETVGDVCYSCLSNDSIDDGTVPVGRPLPGVTLKLDESTNEVVITGGSFANGYYNTLESLHPFNTGDVGFYKGDCLYIRGRIGDVENVNGILTSPTEVETMFQRAFGCPCSATIHEGSAYLLVESDSIAGFTRQKMYELQIPWNLIPRCLFSIHCLPRTNSGKVQRVAVKKIILEELQRNGNTDVSSATFRDPLVQAIGSILDVSPSKVDRNSSFIDLGGDSHLSVALWHKLRALKLLKQSSSIQPIDLLWAQDMNEIESLLKDGPQPERKRKMPQKGSQSFTPPPVRMLQEGHFCVSFPGCVDSKPLFDDGFIYGACQSGVILRVNAETKGGDTVQSITIEGGWRIQSSLVCSPDTIIACCSRFSEDGGLVVCVNKQLNKILWQTELQSSIKATPLLSENVLLVHSAEFLFMLNSRDGSHVMKNKLRGASECRPVELLGQLDLTASRFLYAFSDWDCGVAIVDVQDASFTCNYIEGINVPARAEPLVLTPDRAIVVDDLGFVHDIDLKARTTASKQVAAVAFCGSPTRTPEGNIVLGCNDGILRCLSLTDLSVVLWKVSIGQVVRSAVLSTKEDGFVVSTTAGSVFSVVIGKDPPMLRRIASVQGEIWSDPVLGTWNDSGRPLSRRILAFGARDSGLHFITLS